MRINDVAARSSTLISRGCKNYRRTPPCGGMWPLRRYLERFVDLYQPEEFSIGDYVLSGGELASMVLIDGVAPTVAWRADMIKALLRIVLS